LDDAGFLDIGPQHLEYRMIGPRPAEAPTLVLLHEGLGCVGLWGDFPEKLQQATGCGVFVYSRAGYGKSSPVKLPRPLSYMHDEARDTLPKLLDAIGFQRGLLIGHSDGASIALIHAAHRPVSGLVLIAPHVFVEEICLQAIRATRESYLRGDLRELLARHHDDPDAAFWGWCDVWLDPVFVNWSLENEARRVSAPTLLIQGAEDPYGSLEQLARIEARARGYVERLVLDSGHNPHFDHHRRVTDAIKTFLARLPTPAPGLTSPRNQ
jgi:pimeloyl-ACP methyl ester carboxylesterase